MRKWIALLTFCLLSFTTMIGCASDRGEPPIEAIPARGVRVGTGTGRLFFAAPHVGTLYVYDADLGSLIYTQPMKENEQFVLDPMTKQFTLNGKRLEKAPTFDHHHVHEFYYVGTPVVPQR